MFTVLMELSNMASLYFSQFCVSCMHTSELLLMNKPFKPSSNETFSNLLKKCFSLELPQDDSQQYICLRCSYRLIDAVNFKEELESTLQILLEIANEKNYVKLDDEEIHSPENNLDNGDDDQYDENDLKPLKILSSVKKKCQKNKTSCPICKNEFDNPKTLKRHIRQLHWDRFKCDKCAKVFIWESSLQRHQKNHNPELIEKREVLALERQKRLLDSPKKKKVQYKEPLPFTLEPNQTVCALCNAEFTLPRMLAIHMHDHYPLHVCEQCGKGYATKASLRRHKVSHISGPFTCQHCGKVYEHLNTLLGHVRMRHGRTQLLYPCDKCDLRFATALQRIDHKAQAHGEKTKTYTCPHCHRVFKRYVHMLTHIQSRHVPDSKRTCAFCSKQFAEVKNLGRHIRKIHKMPFSYKKHSYFNIVEDGNTVEYDE